MYDRLCPSTNDYMDSHQFQEGIKIQRFCLTLVGEVRLWYESLRPINIDGKGLTQENNYSMHDYHFTLMKIQKHWMHM